MTALCLVHCTQPGNYRLSLVFPDEEAASAIRSLTIWVLEPGGFTCEPLLFGQTKPTELIEIAKTVLAYPPQDGLPALSLQAGEVMIFVEARLQAGETVLGGCSKQRIRANADVLITVELDWMCRPQTEQPSNAIDDDCDGQTDECENKAVCDDNNVCTADFCVLEICQNTAFPDGLLCDDEDLCTIGDSCIAGVCQGTPKDCSTLDGDCTTGMCDPHTGECVRQNNANGTVCDDNLYCTESDSCQDGICQGSPHDCNDGIVCTLDACDEAQDICFHVLQPNPGAEGPEGDASCHNGLDDDCDSIIDEADPNCQSCSEDDQCDDGNDCTNDTCDSGDCQNQPAENGLVCDDELSCTQVDTCHGGICSGDPVDCSWLTDSCNTGVCQESTGLCLPQPITDGTPCEDGSFCTTSDNCNQGVCSGASRDCDDGDACTLDACDEVLNACKHTLFNIADAEGPIDDPTCQNGVDDDCDGLIDLEDGNCVACLIDTDCEDNNPCTDDVCNISECSNTAAIEGRPCADGLSCTEGDSCSDGSCVGESIDCSAFDGSCLVGVCDEQQQGCVALPAENQTPCDDQDPCTSGDVCQESQCTGQPADEDGDGYVAAACGGADCDDNAFDVHPGAPEGPYGDASCQDAADNNCDELVDAQDFDCHERTLIYRSVGPGNIDPLAQGDPNQLTITGSIAVLTTPVPDNIGVGDVLIYDANDDGQITTVDGLGFIHRRVSSSRFYVRNSQGQIPLATNDNVRWWIYRAYTSLYKAEMAEENSAIDPDLADFDPEWGRDLVGDNKIWHIVCYADAPDVLLPNQTLTLQRWVTSSEHWLKIYAPYLESEVGVSQRHAGMWTESAYRLEYTVQGDYQRLMTIGVNNLYLEGLQIWLDTDSYIGVAVRSYGHDVNFSNSILRGSGGNGQGFNLDCESGDDHTAILYNNIIFDMSSTSSSAILVTGCMRAYLYNNTLFRNYRGISLSQTNGATALLLNNLALEHFDQDYFVDGTFMEGSSNNASSDSSAADFVIGQITQLSAQDTFVDPSNGDLHLKTGSVCQDAARELSADPIQPFSNDIDGQSRPQPAQGDWDIGADEVP